MRDIEERLSELEAREAIRELKHEYCYCNDVRDWERLMELFTDDAVWDGGELYGVHRGRREIERFFRESVPRRLRFAVHMVTNPIIKVSGDRATGTWYLLEPMTLADGNKAVWFQARYDEEYVREGGRWKFKLIKLSAIFLTPYDKGWVKERFTK